MGSKPRIWNKLGERVRRDFLFQAVTGTLTGVAVFKVQGYDSDLAEIRKAIWPGTTAFPRLTSAELLNISSNSNDDDYLVGPGAKYIRIIGLDSSFNIQIEDIPLRGTVPSGSAGSYIRVLDAAVLTAGAITGAVGTITIETATSSTLIGTIDNNYNKLTNGVFTVPNATTGYIFNYQFAIASDIPVEYGIRHSTPGDNPCWVQDVIRVAQRRDYDHELKTPIFLPEKTDVEFTAKVLNDTCDTPVTVEATIVLIDDDFEWPDLAVQSP